MGIIWSIFSRFSALLINSLLLVLMIILATFYCALSLVSQFFCICKIPFTSHKNRRTLKYLEFLTCTPSPSPFRDCFNFEACQVGRFSLYPVARNESDGDIDEKLLQRMTQEDLRGKAQGRFTKKLKHIHSSRNTIGRRILAKAPEFGLTSAPKPVLSAPKIEIEGQSPGNVRSRRRKQFQRSSSEGAGMTSLLVASLMSSQTMGLDRISESHDSRPSSQESKHLSTSMDISQSIDTLCMSQSSKTSLFPSFESDSLSSDDEASDSTPERVEVCFDADTVSMVMRNVEEKSEDAWIEPKLHHRESIKVGSSRIIRGDSGQQNEMILVESGRHSREETLQEIMKTCPENLDARDDVSWIKPGSTFEEPELSTGERSPRSFLKTLRSFNFFGRSKKSSLKLILKEKFSRKTSVKKPNLKIRAIPPTPSPKQTPDDKEPARGVPFMSLIELADKDALSSSKTLVPDRHNSLPVTLISVSVEQPSMASNTHKNLSHTNQLLLAPSPLFPVVRNEAAPASGAAPASPGVKTPSAGHTRAESTGSRITQSPAKTAASAVPGSNKDSGIYRRSSDSDLSVTPKGESFLPSHLQ